MKVAELLDAAGAGDREEVVRLLGEGVSPDVTDVDGRTPLVIAASNDHLEIVQTLLDAGADLSIRDKYGRTALTRAIQYNDAQTTALLRSAGASIAPPSPGEPAVAVTLLHAAVRARNDDFIRELAEAGWPSDILDTEGRSPLVDVLKRRGMAAGRFDVQAHSEALVRAERLAATVAVLLEVGADPNLTDPSGMAALL